MHERVLITGARAAAALDLARDFDRAGFEVHMADCAPARISRWSRAVERVHRYPSPVRDPAGFAARIEELARTLEPRLIIPSCEEVFHLAMPRLASGLGGRLFQPPAAMLRQLHDKGAFAAMCRKLALPMPDTHAIDRRRDLEPFLGHSAEWVFKSRFSRFGEGTLIDPDAAALAALEPGPDRPWIAQRRVTGREVSFYAVARRGELVAFAAYGGKWRLGGGASISFDPVEGASSAAIMTIARKLAAAHDLSGQFACDLIVDALGQPWLLECNPRATSGVHLLAHGGRLARAMTGTIEGPVTPDGRSFHLLPALLTYGLGQALRAGRLAAWHAQLRAGMDVAGKAGDRLPMIGAMLDGLGFMLAGAMRRTSTAAATTADIEWNGEEWG